MLGQNPTDYCAGPAPRLPPCAELDFGLFFSSQSAFLPWVIGPLLKAVEEYKASLVKYPNPPAANLTKF